MKTCSRFYLLCECPNREYKSKSVDYCDWCLFYGDMLIYCNDFNVLRRSSKFMKIVRVFGLFLRIINYWNRVNKKEVGDFFSSMPSFDQLCL